MLVEREFSSIAVKARLIAEKLQGHIDNHAKDPEMFMYHAKVAVLFLEYHFGPDKKGES